MIISILGTLIGAAVTGVGLYYLKKEKDDPESKKIYSVISGVGAVILLIAAVKLILQLQ